MERAEPQACELLRTEALDALPAEGQQKLSIQQSLAKVQAVLAKPLVIACDRVVAADLTTLTTVLRNLVVGQSPTALSVSSGSAFFREAMQRCEGFAVLEVPDKGPPCVHLQLHGRKAIEWAWTAFERVCPMTSPTWDQ